MECHFKEISKTGLNVYLPCGVCEKTIKSVSIRKPGRTKQEVIQLKSRISLKLGTNAGFGEVMIMAKTKVKIFYSLQVRGTPSKNGPFSLTYAYLISCL